jgi:hypothetical protein
MFSDVILHPPSVVGFFFFFFCGVLSGPESFVSCIVGVRCSGMKGDILLLRILLTQDVFQPASISISCIFTIAPCS